MFLLLSPSKSDWTISLARPWQSYIGSICYTQQWSAPKSNKSTSLNTESAFCWRLGRWIIMCVCIYGQKHRGRWWMFHWRWEKSAFTSMFTVGWKYTSLFGWYKEKIWTSTVTGAWKKSKIVEITFYLINQGRKIVFQIHEISWNSKNKMKWNTWNDFMILYWSYVAARILSLKNDLSSFFFRQF